MESKLLKILTKYIVIMLIHSVIFFPWMMILNVSNDRLFETVDDIQTYGDYFVKIITALLIFLDFKKEKLPYIAIACVSSLFYPFLGIVIFALLYLEKQNKASV